jgi:hypothetical protein
MKFFVIAGTIEQARNWIKEDAKRRWEAGETSVSLSDYISVFNPTQIKGYSNPHGRFVGTWWNRDDIPDLITHLTIQSIGFNPGLDTAREIYESKRRSI